MTKLLQNFLVFSILTLISCNSLQVLAKTVNESARTIPVAYDVDIVVVGGKTGRPL